jgi:hypothetical protein
MTAPTTAPRELAQRWAWWHDVSDDVEEFVPPMAETDELTPAERERLFTWVRERMRVLHTPGDAWQLTAIKVGVELGLCAAEPISTTDDSDPGADAALALCDGCGFRLMTWWPS